ncbi:MAG: molybdate ABC transporter substrate-binding protein [Tissierellia bacterium]|nr:molybdate ABC transporter substrate-binding protein [Tissierellia bacterium]
MRSLLKIGMLACTMALLTSCSNKNANSENIKSDIVSTSQIDKEDNSSEKKIKGEITIGAAASLTDAFDEIIEKFNEENPDVKIKTTYASSGDIQTQIENGAPIDLFVSAAQKQMDQLEQENLIVKDTRFDLLENKVVLITPKDSKLNLETFENVADNDDIKKGDVAIGMVDSVPVGQYTKEIYENLGLWEKVEQKANWAKDVRQVLDWVSQGESKVGIVYQTDAFTEKDKVNIVAKAPDKSHKPVVYPVALVKNSENQKLANSFLEYLKTDNAKKILTDYGFEVK